MYRAKLILDKESLLALYYSYIHSYINYANYTNYAKLWQYLSSTLNFSKPKLTLTKTKYRISIMGSVIWNDFVEDCLKGIGKTPFFKFKMKSKLLNLNNA